MKFSQATSLAFGAFLVDGYKKFHGSAIHDDIDSLYGNFTNRSGRLSNLPDNRLGGVVSITTQAACQVLVNMWEETFFSQPKDKALSRIKNIMGHYLLEEYDVSHYADLYDVGHLPVTIKGVPEGTIVPYGVAPYTVRSTLGEKFRWFALYVETFLSASTWHSSTNCTTAAFFMLQAKQALKLAGLDETMLPYMIHDFSMRGLDIEATPRLGYAHAAAGHYGSDTLPAIFFAEEYYGADPENETVICSVKATEHSITTSFIMTYAQEHNVSLFEAEVVYMRKLIKENPNGVLSYVADSFDFWRIVTEALPMLKDEINARNGTFVIRPDSGTPAEILCGTFKLGKDVTFDTLEDAKDWAIDNVQDEVLEDASEQGCYPADTYTRMVQVGSEVLELSYSPEGWGVKQDRGDRRYYLDCINYKGSETVNLTPEQKGLVQCLAETFGTTSNGTVNCLPTTIGWIYGDAITVLVQWEIYTRLMAKGLSPFGVLGVGSFSYQYVTRDTHGSAVKATAAFLKDGTLVDVCKDPKTDPNKKSAKGLLFIYRDLNGNICQVDGVTEQEEATGLYDLGPRVAKSIYIEYLYNGEVISNETLAGTRALMAEQLAKLV